MTLPPTVKMARVRVARFLYEPELPLSKRLVKSLELDLGLLLVGRMIRFCVADQ